MMDELTEKGEQYPLDLALGGQQKKMLAEEDAARYHRLSWFGLGWHMSKTYRNEEARNSPGGSSNN